MQLSNYLWKKKVEFEGETLSTPINSALTGERPRMSTWFLIRGTEMLPQPVQKPEVIRERQFSSY